jgi:hypothetical protein
VAKFKIWVKSSANAKVGVVKHKIMAIFLKRDVMVLP